MTPEANLPTVDSTSVSSHFDARLAPVLRVEPGQRFKVRTRSILSHVETRDPDVFASIASFDHMDIPVTGPVHVVGAEPGDVLRIDIHGIEIAQHGAMVTLAGRGGFTRELEPAGKLLPIVDGEVIFDHVRLPVQPMIGKIGLARAEAPHCSTVGGHGGNMDCTLVGAGASLHLPVTELGAKLFLGDLHARQGDGEASLTGVEVEGVVTLSCYVLSDWALKRPLLITEDSTITIGDGEDLDEAARVALDDMLQLVRSSTGWTLEASAMFLSAAADVAVCQVVNARKSARATLSRRFLTPAIPFRTKD